MATETDDWKRQALDTIDAFRVENGDLNARITRLEARNARLTEALEHYSERCDLCDRVEGVHGPGCCVSDCGQADCCHPICETFKNVAQEALKED